MRDSSTHQPMLVIGKLRVVAVRRCKVRCVGRDRPRGPKGHSAREAREMGGAAEGREQRGVSLEPISALFHGAVHYPKVTET